MKNGRNDYRVFLALLSILIGIAWTLTIVEITGRETSWITKGAIIATMSLFTMTVMSIVERGD